MKIHELLLDDALFGFYDRAIPDEKIKELISELHDANADILKGRWLNDKSKDFYLGMLAALRIVIAGLLQKKSVDFVGGLSAEMMADVAKMLNERIK